MTSIKVLPPTVANQIAAGEVVERPASVLKELLENSIDAGAQKIDIRAEGGGISRLQITDDGCGMVKEDLPMAMLQHATSKICSVEDIEKIQSLGFRGEALASISSVAKVKITSKHQHAKDAWSISNQGTQTIEPAAHNVGTTVLMEDLFYNTPARKKFLRRPSTEYHALEDIFRRMALVQFEVALSFTHDGRLVKRLAPCVELAQRQARVAQFLGEQTLEHSRFIDIHQNGLRLWGWLGLPETSRAQATHQYFFINQRMVKDRLVNHALREAYQSVMEAGRYPVYCLYLELPADELDVNVHPTKHEVRFRHARVVHCFLEDAVREALSAQASVNIPQPQSPGLANVAKPWSTSALQKPTQAYQQLIPQEQVPQGPNARLLTLLHDRYATVLVGSRLFLMDIVLYRYQKCYVELSESWEDGKLLAAPLIMAHSVSLTAGSELKEIEQLKSFGFECSEIGPGALMVRTIPQPLLGQDIHYQAVIEQCIQWLKSPLDFTKPSVRDKVSHWLAKETSEGAYHHAEIMQWLRALDDVAWVLTANQQQAIKEITLEDCKAFFKSRQRITTD